MSVAEGRGRALFAGQHLQDWQGRLDFCGRNMVHGQIEQ